MKPYSILGGGCHTGVWVLCYHTSPNLPTSTSHTPLRALPLPLLLRSPCHIPHPTSHGGLSIHQTGDHLQWPPPRLSCPGCLLPSPRGILSKQAILTDHTTQSELCLLSPLPLPCSWTLTSPSFSSARKSSLSLAVGAQASSQGLSSQARHTTSILCPTRPVARSSRHCFPCTED